MSEGKEVAAQSSADAAASAATAASQAENERVAAAGGHQATNEQIAQTSGANAIREKLAAPVDSGSGGIVKALAAPSTPRRAPSKPAPTPPPSPPSPAQAQARKAKPAPGAAAKDERAFVRPTTPGASFRRSAQHGAFDPRQRSQGQKSRASNALNAPGQTSTGPTVASSPGSPHTLPSGGFNPKQFEEDQRLLGAAGVG